MICGVIIFRVFSTGYSRDEIIRLLGKKNIGKLISDTQTHDFNMVINIFHCEDKSMVSGPEFTALM